LIPPHSHGLKNLRKIPDVIDSWTRVASANSGASQNSENRSLGVRAGLMAADFMRALEKIAR
jgi:hypothetical protein